MKACGVACDKEALGHFFTCIGDKSIPSLIAEGQKKTVSMPRGGGGGAPAAAASGGAAKAEEAPKEDEKKE